MGGSLQQFDNMSLNCFQRLSFLLLLLVIAAPALSLNWQGSGNLTQDNMTEIQNTIRAYPPLETRAANAEAQSISTHLNQIWDPAWNVVIVNTLAGHDVILYGYAFRGHWMWMNEIFINSDSMADYRLSYVIWKDYNCHNWYTFTNLFMSGGSTFTSEQKSVIDNYSSQGSVSDPWGNAHTFVEYINSHNLFNTGAYSAIMCESKICTPSAYICLVDRNYRIQNPFGGLADGSVFLFQTRIIQQ